MRIVTRGDLDGMVASVLLSTMQPVDSIVLVNPQDITDRKFPVQPDDILANLPYDPACAMWFDHHAHTVMPEGHEFRGSHSLAPSVARVVYDYFDSSTLHRYESLVREADRFDSASLTREDIIDPRGAIMLGFLLDPRTGLEGDNKQLFLDLVELLRTQSVEEVMLRPEITRRIELYYRSVSQFQDFLLAHSEVDGNVIVTDLREAQEVPAGNRFLVYTAFPHCNVSVRIQWGEGRAFVAVNIGHSILDRSCLSDVGALCREYGGGGHRSAGACVLAPDNAEFEIHDIIERLIEED